MVRCASCGFEAPEMTWCPDCGAGVEASASSGTDAESLPAWETSGSAFPQNLFETWRRSVFEPTRFFEGVPFDRPAARPVLYYLIIGLISAFFGLWWSAVFSSVSIPFLAELTDGAGELSLGAGRSAAASALVNFFLAPFVAMAMLVISSLFIHLFVLMLGRQRRDLKATVRAVAYAGGPSLLGVVPIIGWLVGGIWTIVLTVIGIRSAHRMTTGTAAAVVLMAWLLPLTVLVTLILMLAFAISSLGI